MVVDNELQIGGRNKDINNITDNNDDKNTNNNFLNLFCLSCNNDDFIQLQRKQVL